MIYPSMWNMELLLAHTAAVGSAHKECKGLVHACNANTKGFPTPEP